MAMKQKMENKQYFGGQTTKQGTSISQRYLKLGTVCVVVH
jgi:hypothetical protein